MLSALPQTFTLLLHCHTIPRMSPKLILSNVLTALLARAYGSRWTIGNEPSVPGAPKHLHHLEVLQNAWSFNTSHLEISDVAAVRSHDRMAGCSDAGLFDIVAPENQVKTIKPFFKRLEFLSARISVKKARSVSEGPMARELLAALVLGLYNGSEKSGRFVRQSTRLTDIKVRLRPH